MALSCGTAPVLSNTPKMGLVLLYLSIDPALVALIPLELVHVQ